MIIEIRGEFASADASGVTETTGRFALYRAGGMTALALESTDTVVITYCRVVVAAAMIAQVFDGDDADVEAGEKICEGDFAANGGIIEEFPIRELGDDVVIGGHHCQTGTYPKIKTSAAGNVKAAIRGFIIRRSQQ